MEKFIGEFFYMMLLIIVPFIILMIGMLGDNIRRPSTVFGSILILASIAICFRIYYVSGFPGFSFFYVTLTNLPLLGAVAFYYNSKDKEFYMNLIPVFSYIILFSNILLWLPIILMGDPAFYMKGVFLGFFSAFLCLLFFIFYGIRSKWAKMRARKKAVVHAKKINE